MNKTKRGCFISDSSLLLDIVKELVHFENARTVTLVTGKKKAVSPLIDDSIEKHLFNNDVVMTGHLVVACTDFFSR